MCDKCEKFFTGEYRDDGSLVMQTVSEDGEPLQLHKFSTVIPGPNGMPKGLGHVVAVDKKHAQAICQTRGLGEEVTGVEIGMQLSKAPSLEYLKDVAEQVSEGRIEIPYSWEIDGLPVSPEEWMAQKIGPVSDEMAKEIVDSVQGRIDSVRGSILGSLRDETPRRPETPFGFTPAMIVSMVLLPWVLLALVELFELTLK